MLCLETDSRSNFSFKAQHCLSDVLSLLQEVDWLQPLVSPAVLRMERQEIDDTGKREISRMKLRKRCSGLEHGHCLCYRAHDDDQHIELSEEDVEVSVEEWWEGERNCHDPPNNIQIRASSTNATSKLNPYRRRAIDWGVVSSPASSSSSLEISPGYYCGVGLERVGRTVLHNAKTAALMAKLMIYKRMVYGNDGAFIRLIRKHLTPPRLGIVIQETIDLMRPTYPRQIRQQASLVSELFWSSSVIRRRKTTKLMAYLASAFNLCPGARWEDRDRPSTAITSSLYNAVIKSPLHTNLKEVASAFILQIAGYLSSFCKPTCLLLQLEYIVDQTCHVRQLSVKELTAIRGCIEFWVQPHNYSHRRSLLVSPMQLLVRCIHEDAWFRDIAGDVLKVIVADTNHHIASLTLIMDMDTTYSLWYGISDLKTFFGNRTLHTHHIKQLNVVHSLIEPLLRLILTHPSPNVNLVWSGDKLIEVTLNLIAGSSDIESACSTVRNLDIIAILPRLLPHCEAMRGSLDDQYLGFLEALLLAAQGLLCVIATPFTSVCATSNSNTRSVLEDHGWSADALAPSIPSDMS
ncbi:hypothetical protein BU17DRAFT_81904 [Hysterangium stoloniferum]|nr:hypothetical protein BU17DRAFT_81904 [Hysterangium stoloniferum]